MERPGERSEKLTVAFDRSTASTSDRSIASASYGTLVTPDKNVKASWGCCAQIARFRNRFDDRLLVLGFITQFVLQGFTCAFVDKAQKWVYVSYGVPAQKMMVYMGVAMLPMSCQPIIGLCSDLLPINGYSRGPYLALATLLGAVCFSAVGFLPQALLPVQLVVVCLVCINLQFATVKLLWSAKYAEEMHKTPEFGPDVGAVINFGMQLFTLLATLVAGVTITNLGPKAPYAISMPLALSVMLPALRNFFSERKVTPEELAAARVRFRSQPEACALACAMLVGSVVIGVTSICFSSVPLNALVSSCVGLAILVLLAFTLCPTIARPIIFFFTVGCCTPSIDSATMFFFTDTLEQFSWGPHFSKYFYISTLPCVIAFACLVGVAIYRRFFSHWRYRRLFVAAKLFVAAVLVCEALIMLTGTTTKLGISNHAYFLTQTVVFCLADILANCCKFVMLPNLCPSNMEATVFALIMGADSMSNTVAANISALLMEGLGVDPTGAAGVDETLAFNNLWIAGLFVALLPLVPISCLFWLLPDRLQNESLIGELQATEGSPLRRLLRR